MAGLATYPVDKAKRGYMYLATRHQEQDERREERRNAGKSHFQLSMDLSVAVASGTLSDSDRLNSHGHYVRDDIPSWSPFSQ